MTSPIYWPPLLAPVGHPDPVLGGQSRSGGRTLSGRESIVQSDAGSWTMSLNLYLRNSQQILCWQAIRAKCSGRTHVLSVPLFNCGHTPGALPAFRLPSALDLHSDGSTFSDGSVYQGRVYHAVLGADLAERATSMELVILDTPAVAPWPAMKFEIGGRIYQLVDVGEVADGQCTCTFEPPLRATALAGDDVVFDGGRGRWRLADDRGGTMPPRPQAAPVSLTVDLVEDY